MTDKNDLVKICGLWRGECKN